MLNLYPPLLFQRIHVASFGLGFRTADVRVARSVLTRNLHGTTFGGTIFSAADPVYAIMYWQIFARRGMRVRTWLKSACIDYLAPATTALRLACSLSEDDVAEAQSALEREGRFSRTHSIDAVDRRGQVCAVIGTEVYLRLARAGDRREGSAF